MANQSNSRNRNRNSSNQGWENGDNRDWRNSNYDSDRNRYGSGAGQGRSEYGGYDSGRSSGENDWRSGRNMYGSSTGIMPGGRNYGGSSYSGMDQDDWNRDSYRQDSGRSMNRGDWGMSESNRGRGGYDRGMYGNDQGRNEDRDWWDRTKDEVSSWFGDDDADRRRRQDHQQGGEHRGKGPKGYIRSDERIKEDVNDHLSDDPYVDASEIDVTVKNCEVTLTGTVNSRAEKRHAEDVVESVSGVKNVENRIRVNTTAGQGSQGTQGQGGNSGLGQPYRSSAGTYDASKS